MCSYKHTHNSAVHTNFIISGKGIGSITGGYNVSTGKTDYNLTPEQLGDEFDAKFNEKSIIPIPDWIASSVIKSIADEDYTPQTLEEAQSLSPADAKYNSLVRMTLNTVTKLVDAGKTDVSFHGYDGSQTVGFNDEGEGYERKFTNKYRLSGKFSTSGKDGINIAIDAKIDYTDEKCTSCD